MASENKAEKPVIGITIGDFNGIGPEVILKTLSDQRILKICTPVVYGSLKIFNKYKKMMHLPEDVHFHVVKNAQEIVHKKINLINCWEDDLEAEPGKITPQAGIAAYQALEKATADVVAKNLDAIVTAPVNKKNIQQENFKFPGHTEYLASHFNTEPLMMMVSDDIRIAVVTGHIPLSEVKSSVTTDKIAKKLNILYKSLKNDFMIAKPRIAVLGLNPHAGEEGLLGKEEQEIIMPLLEDLRSKGLLIFGPYPADGFFGMQMYSKFDGVMAMYHDQGLIPFKTLYFDSGVNFTAGIPIIRTSPDHGTAYDIAGKNKADESSMRNAVYMAADMVRQKKPVSV
jgi:4-hydroxythreonine-4-phosphate dehydrogenase